MTLSHLKPGSRFPHPTTGEPYRLVSIGEGSVTVQPARRTPRTVNGRTFKPQSRTETWSRATEVRP